MKILGIDPGTTTVGYAIIEKENSRFHLLDFWVISTPPKIDISIKLVEIGADLQSLIETHNPERVVIEKLYFQNNSKTAIDVAQARWVIVYEAVKSGVKVFDFTPLQVKKAVTGNGKANKKQLQTAVKILFWLEQLPKYDDAADAIGLAYMGALQNTF